MEIRERPEGDTFTEGAQITRTPFADYYWFQHGEQRALVRIPKEGPMTAEMMTTDG